MMQDIESDETDVSTIPEVLFLYLTSCLNIRIGAMELKDTGKYYYVCFLKILICRSKVHL
jgi:hypothetical protein